MENMNLNLASQIAVVGIGCRLPGGASSPSKLLRLLRNRDDGFCKVPQERFNIDGFYSPDSERPGSINVEGGYFLNYDPRNFDHEFFKMNRLEASHLDPQQRQLLEVVYECFESAGAKDVSGSNTGCFVANFTTDFVHIQTKDPETYSRYSLTGMGLTLLANRISHFFDLKGPSCVLDTACSSSLYALHLACAAILRNDCDSAVVAASNLIQSPELYMAGVKAGLFSPTSKSHTFDAAADGYGRGEGKCIVAFYLKRADVALASGDPLRAIVRGTAVNSDGYTPGITLPNVTAQESVIRKAYMNAGLEPQDTLYVEAHGTGTPTGDPIEIEAIARVFGNEGTKTLVGSLKPSIGHGEAASGLSSVLKAILMLENNTLLPTIGISSINPDLKLHERGIDVVTEQREWPQEATRRISVNSFGYGGANAHAIIESASEIVSPYSKNVPAKGLEQFLLPFSASSVEAVRANQQATLAYDHITDNLSNIAYTLGCRRSFLSCRSFSLYPSESPSIDAIKSSDIEIKVDVPRRPICFVFTGQGAQWPRMGFNLLNRYQSFKNTIEMLDSQLRSIPASPEYTLEEAISAEPQESQMDHALFSQPVTTAIQIALVDLLQTWGIQPQKVIGHSSGEIAAAYAANYISAEQAITTAYYRGLSVSQSNEHGSMLVCSLGHQDVDHLLADHDFTNQIRVACINSPSSTTISGEADAIQSLHDIVQETGAFVRVLETKGKAYHSKQMSNIGGEYEKLLQEAQCANPPQDFDDGIKMISTVTGAEIDAITVRSPAYWRRNLESPVLFSDGLGSLLQDSECHVIEVGPHPALQRPVQEIAAHQEVPLTYFSTLSRGHNEATSLLKLSGKLFQHGHELNFLEVNGLASCAVPAQTQAPKLSVVPDLPSYPWQYSDLLWEESRTSSELRQRQHCHHELLGSRMAGGTGSVALWRNVLGVKRVPWLGDHKIEDAVVFPAACYLVMTLEALSQIGLTRELEEKSALSGFVFRQLYLDKMLVLPTDGSDVELFTELECTPISATAKSESWWRMRVSSFSNGLSATHATGEVSLTRAGDIAPGSENRLPNPRKVQRSINSWYDGLRKAGLAYGPRFRPLDQIVTDRHGETMLCEAKIARQEDNAQQDLDRFAYLPEILDALLQAGIIASSGGLPDEISGILPQAINRVSISMNFRPDVLGTSTVHAETKQTGLKSFRNAVDLRGSDGTVLLSMCGAHMLPFKDSSLETRSLVREPACQMLWKPDPLMLEPDGGSIIWEHFQSFREFLPSTAQNSCAGLYAAILDIWAHKNPRLEVLEIVHEAFSCPQRTFELFQTVQRATSLKSYSYASWSSGAQAGKGTKLGKPSSLWNNPAFGNTDSPPSRFDLILLPTTTQAQGSLCEEVLCDLLKKDGSLVACAAVEADAGPTIHDRQITSTEIYPFLDEKVVMKRCSSPEKEVVEPASSKLFIVYDEEEGELERCLDIAIVQTLGADPVPIIFGKLSEDDIPPGSIVFCTVELKKPLLAKMTAGQFQALKMLSARSSVLLWITRANCFIAEDPSFWVVLGLARTLMVENVSLRMPVLGIGTTENENELTARNCIKILNYVLSQELPDAEFIQHKGVLHVSRAVPVKTINDRFQQAHKSVSLKATGLCELTMSSPGHLDTTYFEEKEMPEEILEGFVEVQVKAIAVNARDYLTLNRKVETPEGTCASDFAGVIVRSRSDRFQAGDRVVCMAPRPFSTMIVVPQWTCLTLHPTEKFSEVCALPTPFSTAIYALEHQARLRPGESILIHAAMGGVGQAAVQIAHRVGANVYTTAETSDEKEFLEQQLKVPSSRILSRDASFGLTVLAATANRGVDVVLSSLTGDLLHECWSTLAPFGRFIDIRGEDATSSGFLNVQRLERSASYDTIDLTDLYWSRNRNHHDVWFSLLRRTFEMFRTGAVKFATPLKTFDVSQIKEGLGYAGDANGVSKVVISMEGGESKMQVAPTKFRTRFDPSKAYLLIGGLGGLGRSISSWMFTRGARNFVFLNPSGGDKPRAKASIKALEAMGARVHTVKGSVTSYDDVKRALSEPSLPIGGILHSAMAVHATLFQDMTLEAWNKGIEQKIQGAWNLHRAVEECKIKVDFFLLLSSISGTLGSATEANYCAANAFLDAFARYRRRLGLPATAVGLGMIAEVGYIAENPDVETALYRKGIYAYPEDEFHRILDIALTPSQDNVSDTLQDRIASRTLAQAHFTTGVELQGFQRLRELGFRRNLQVIEDPRLSVVTGSFVDAVRSGEAEEELTTESSGLPPAVSKALTLAVSALSDSGPSSADSNQTSDEQSSEKTSAATDTASAESSLHLEIRSVLADKLGPLLLTSKEKLSDPSQQLAEFGIDSMLSAELRSDIHRSLGVEVPFNAISDARATVGSVEEYIVRNLIDSRMKE